MRELQAQVLKPNLEQAIKRVYRAASSKSPLPITRNILIQSDGGRLWLTATDLDITITALAGARVDSEGATTVNASLLRKAVAALPKGGVINLAVDGAKNLTITCGDAKQQIVTLPAEDFPKVPDVGIFSSFTVPGNALRTAIQRVIHGVATDDSRPVLTAAQLKGTPGAPAVLASADGYRLNVAPIPELDEFDGEILIPGRTLRELLPWLSDEDVAISINGKDRTRVQFTIETATLTSQLIQGTFPDYRQLIPEDFAMEIIVCADLLRQALAVVTPYAALGSDIVRFSVTGPGRLMLRAVADESGEAETTIDVVTAGDITGQAKRVALNRIYVRDALEPLDGDVRIQLKSPSTQCMITSADSNDGFSQVIMPMFIQW